MGRSADSVELGTLSLISCHELEWAASKVRHMSNHHMESEGRKTLRNGCLTMSNTGIESNTILQVYLSSCPYAAFHALTLSSTRSVWAGVSRLSESSKLLKPLSPHRDNIALSSSHPEHGVVNIFSPVKIALAPAMNACFVSSVRRCVLTMACSVSLNVCLPAASRMIALGKTIRAVAIVRRTVCTETG